MALSKTYSDPVDFSFSTCPENYKHLALRIEGDEASIIININPEHNLRKDTPLKLNSYDLSVDIELADALNRLRFEHPQVGVVTITSGHPQVFSSGANIYMLKKSSHAFKVNFCKYTNETRLYMEEASRYSNKKFLCALNGTAAGGGYELALACDRIVLIDDKSANVSLPEVPLLGVLPGTGGLTRVIDKRMVRRDLADVFCTMAEGIKGVKAKEWGLVDEVYTKSAWQNGISNEVAKLKQGLKSITGPGITLKPINPEQNSRGFSYQYVDVELSNDRVAKITVKAPQKAEPTNAAAMLERGSDLWLMKAFSELDNALLRLRFFYRDHGVLEFHTQGDKNLIIDAEKPLYQAMAPDAHWFVREVLLHVARVLRRLDTTSRSTIAVINQDSAYAGVLAEILFATDRSYAQNDKIQTEVIALSSANNGLLPTWQESSRLALRFMGQKDWLAHVIKSCNGQGLTISQAQDLGLATFVLDEIDFADELRIFKEERASLSPDALTAMEANLRFLGTETLATKIFGRLSAWQNWVFIRENATGERGALMSYGEQQRAAFDWERC
jgi:benzoyl-CoA-dihydrodiol lyase